jgi:hypothetical protein
MCMWFAEISGEDDTRDTDLGFSKWAEKLHGDVSGFMQFSKFILLYCKGTVSSQVSCSS